MKSAKLKSKIQNFKFLTVIFNFKLLTFNSCRRQGGQALVELLIAMAIAGIVATAGVEGFVASRESYLRTSQYSEASAILNEQLEALRAIRERSWANIAVNGTYHATVSGSEWVLTSGAETGCDLCRQIVIANTCRDSSDAVVDCPSGTVDPSTKKITVTISWSTPQPGSVEQTVYLTRHLNNASNTETTYNDFSDGTASTVTINGSTSPDDVDAGTITINELGDWQSPTARGTFDTDGNTDPKDVFVLGNYAYIVTKNNGSGDEFYIVDTATKTSPEIKSSLNFDYDLNGVHVVGDYAYIATKDDDKELLIINVSDPENPSEWTSWDTTGDKDGKDVFVVGGYAYLVTKNNGGGGNHEFYIIDLSDVANKNLSQPGSAELGADAEAIYVSGDYAYIASKDDDQELQIVDISSKSSPSLAGSYDITQDDNKDAQGVYAAGTTVYLTSKTRGGGAEFFVLDASTPGSVSLTGSYEVNADVQDVVVSGDLAFLATKLANKELLILNITSPGSISEYGSYDLDGDGQAVTTSGNYVFVASNNDDKELQIFLGGGIPGTSNQNIYQEAMMNSWTLSDSGGGTSTNASEQETARTDSNSLSFNPVADGYMRWSKSFDTSGFDSLDFYVNSVSPWVYGVWGQNAGNPDGTTTITNSTYSDFDINDSAFTDLPVPDMASFKSLAQSASSYISAGGSDYTLDEDDGDISAYEGKLVYVEFTNTAKKLKLKFDDGSGSFNVSFITNGKIELDKYDGATLSSISNSYPVLLSENQEIKFKKDKNMTVNGFIYTGDKVKSDSLGGDRRITLNGTVVAGTVDNKLERMNITYTADYNTTPPTYFSPNYYSQTLDVLAESGSTVAMNDYLSGSSIDKDPTTWQNVNVSLSDLGVESTTTEYFQLTENTSSDQAAVLFDDVLVQISGGGGGGGDYETSGDYESSTFDAGATVAFNGLDWSAIEPSGCDVKFQVDTSATDGPWSYFGTDGTGSTYFESLGGLPFDEVLGRYLRYKAFLTGDGDCTPTLQDVTVNYSQ